MNTTIHYLKYKNEKYMPTDYYNIFSLISIPMVINEKRPFLLGWNKITKSIRPTYINQNYGILTGFINNIIVVDIEYSSLKIFEDLSKKYKEIKTPIQKTPSGGIHIFFQYDPNIKNRIKSY